MPTEPKRIAPAGQPGRLLLLTLLLLTLAWAGGHGHPVGADDAQCEFCLHGGNPPGCPSAKAPVRPPAAAAIPPWPRLSGAAPARPAPKPRTRGPPPIAT